MKTYRFTNDTYWFSNACDCCEDLEMPTFNSDDTDCNLGSAYSYESCYVQSIITSLGGQRVVPEELEGELWQMSLDDLKSMCEDLNIRVQIEE